MMKTVLYVDPPSGWKYGFPKIYPEGIKNFHDWLVSEGYPKQLIEDLGDNFWCRQWYSEEEEDEA